VGGFLFKYIGGNYPAYAQKKKKKEFALQKRSDTKVLSLYV
jgi:hypothetical protein